MAHIRLDSIHFSYPVFHLNSRSLKIAAMKRPWGQSSGVIQVQAIRDLSLHLKDGDRLGLIGSNGSGKSTLLRVIGGLAHPQRGRVDISGRLLPLIEKGLGINPELSGEANIELPLRFLGASEDEIRHARTWVPEFTGLNQFIHLPVRTYSEGMKARLTFALSTALEADILVLDEWIGAGDINFVEKAENQLKRVIDRTGILVLASHSLSLLRSICTKVLWMEQGRVIQLGDPDEVLDAYVAEMHQRLVAE